MRHRPLLVLISGLAGLVAVAPVFAAENTTPAPQPGASASSTTGPGSPPTSATTATTAAAPGAEDPDASTDPDADADAGASDPSRDPDADASEETTDPDADATEPDADATEPDADASDPAAGDEAAASESCAAPEQQEIPAPEPGTTETFDAGPAGMVEVERMSATDLRIVSATPNDGWTEKIATPSGPRVKGKFTNNDAPEQIVKFAASMNSDGTMLRTKVTDCAA